MKKLRTGAFAAAMFAGAVPAMAADLYQPEVVQAPPAIVEQPTVIAETSSDWGDGWYIRGDIDYHRMALRGTNYITYGTPGGTNQFASTNLKDSFSIGAGLGYNIGKYIRADITADYWFKSDFRGTTRGTCGSPPAPCVSNDKGGLSALVVLANAYVDLGTYHGITPYVGAGIGAARVKWDKLRNTVGGVTTTHAGDSSGRMAWALMAGASYCLTSQTELDLGYRYTRISGGRMFQYAPAAGPGFDDGMHVHEVRAGLRYSFGAKGAATRCAPAPQVVSYQPEPQPMPVYK